MVGFLILNVVVEDAALYLVLPTEGLPPAEPSPGDADVAPVEPSPADVAPTAPAT
jgi:hypothetical protein